MNELISKLTKVDNSEYSPYLDYIMDYVDNKDGDTIYVFDNKKINNLKDKISHFRNSDKIFKYKLDILRKDFENAIIETINRKEYLKRIRKQKLKQINDYERNTN